MMDAYCRVHTCLDVGESNGGREEETCQSLLQIGLSKQAARTIETKQLNIAGLSNWASAPKDRRTGPAAARLYMYVRANCAAGSE